MALSVALAAETTAVVRTRLVEFRVLGSATDATAVSIRVNGDDPIQLGAVTQIDEVVEIRGGRNTIALIATDGMSTVSDVHAVTLIESVRPDDSRNIARLLPRALRTGGPQG